MQAHQVGFHEGGEPVQKKKNSVRIQIKKMIYTKLLTKDIHRRFF